MAVGFFFTMELLVLLGAASGVSPDLLTLIDAEDYFKSRNIAVTAKDMTALAAKDPKDGKTSLQQLLAIRWLGEQKEKSARDTLQQIADGKSAQDPQGFSKDYAQVALAKIDGKPLPPRKVPENSVRAQALEWFPEDVSFFGAGDLRGGLETKPFDEKELREAFKMMVGRGGGLNEMYQFAESVGNIRVDRISFALTSEQAGQGMKIYVRITGKGDPSRLAEFIKEEAKATVTERKADNMLILNLSPQRPDDAPAMALIGDSEMVIAGWSKRNEFGKHMEVLEDMLAVRAGKKTSVAKGPFSLVLENVPANANGLLMGEVPQELRQELGREIPGGAIPRSVSIYAVVGKGIDIKFNGTMENATQAKAFVTAVGDLKKLMTEELKKAPPGMLKPAQLQVLTKQINDIKMEAQDVTVSGGVLITAEAIQTLAEVGKALMKEGFGPGGGAKPPPPPPAEEKAIEAKPVKKEPAPAPR